MDAPAGSREWRRWTDPLVLVTFLLVVGAAVTLARLGAPRFPSDSSSEAGFARDMMDHHAQAVEMAEIVRGRTSDPALRMMAADIALTQQGQIGQMQGWLDEWSLPATGAGPRMTWMGHPVSGLMPGMATQADVNSLQTLPEEQMVVEFLRLMIRHHAGGVGMAQAVLQRTERPEVLRLADSIVASQQSEIEAMQAMLQERGEQPEPVQMHAVQMMEMDGAGFTSSVPAVARDTLRLLLLPLAVFALAWLVLDSLAGRVRPIPAASVGWRVVAAAGLLSSAVLHFGLAPEHFSESTAFGVFFSASGVLLAATAAALAAVPSRSVYLLGACLALGLILLWGLFRVVAPPGADSVERVDLVGVVTKAAELAAFAGCVVLWSRAGRAPRPLLDHRLSRG